MANTGGNLLRHKAGSRFVLSGSFRPNGASAISSANNTGAGFTVARTGTGEFTITLSDSWVALDCATATIQMASATDLTPQWGAIDVVTAKTLVLRTQTAATPTDIASNAANRVHFELVLRNTTVTP